MSYVENNILLICAINPTDLNFMENTFRMYFGDELDIRAVSVDELDRLDVEPRAIITTHLSNEPARRRFPGSHILLSRRGLTGEGLEEVVQLPKGTKALVVNSPRQVAIETKDALTELGIDHIDTKAYWPDAPINIEDYNVVIYAGIMSYCPQGNYKYINIGHRCIAISTIIDIIKIYGLSSRDAIKYYNDNIHQITESCYKLAAALNQTKMMKESFEKICDINKSIIFAINEQGRIVVFNQAAETFFTMNRKRTLGRHYKDVLKSYPALTDAIASGKELNETLLTAKGQKLLVTAQNFYIDDYDNRLISILPFAALQQSESKARMKLHETGFLARYTFKDILGGSESIERSKRTARIYANTNTTILITGESGTGKEVFAQAIHNSSPRSHYPFVGINFAALPETLAESELFGYNEGSFTGAMKGGKEGLFEIAHNGTIFLDEIGDASPAVQAKLLRVLEEKEIVRVGGTKVIPIDVRIICATNRNLREMMNAGTFRSDLYYRIKVLSLHLAPLRERKDDIISILNGMMKDAARRNIADANVLHCLTEYDWPGNIRELRTITEYINMLADMRLTEDHDDEEIQGMLQYFLENNLTSGSLGIPASAGSPSVSQSDPPSGETSTAPEIPWLSDDLLLILDAIDRLQKQCISAGRGSLCRISALSAAGLTETKIKTRLKRLDQMGCVSTGVTRQGVMLTNLGAQILDKVRKNGGRII